MQTNLRHATLPDLSRLLTEQNARSVDVVATQHNIRMEGGSLHLYGTEAALTDDGVTPTEGIYVPTDVFDDGVSSKLDIPRAWLRRMREQRTDIYDSTINMLLHGNNGFGYGPDTRSFLFRLFRGDDGPGIARALLSNRYGIIDNLDVLMAVLDGVRAAGVKVEIPAGGCDLTDRRMHVRITAPQVRQYAPELLSGYHSPFGDQPVSNRWLPESMVDAEDGGTGLLFAGIAVRNSEVGMSRATISPVIIYRTCGNGLTITGEAMKAQHVGGALETGVVKWTEDTEQKQLALITARARDAVATFLDADYMKAKIEELQERAGIKVKDAPAVIETLSKKMNYTETQRATILEHFIEGGSNTAGGIMNAVTSCAQLVTDPDEATRLELSALEALDFAAKAAR